MNPYDCESSYRAVNRSKRDITREYGEILLVALSPRWRSPARIWENMQRSPGTHGSPFRVPCDEKIFYRNQKDRGGVQNDGTAIISNRLSIYYFGRIGIWLYGCMKKYVVDENQPLPNARFKRK